MQSSDMLPPLKPLLPKLNTEGKGMLKVNYKIGIDA